VRQVLYMVLQKINWLKMGKYDEAVYHILSDQVTPNEVAKKTMKVYIEVGE